MFIVAIVLLVIWLSIGFYRLRYEGGWLIMIADSRNVKRTYLVLPALVLCIVFWPINERVARSMFFLATGD